MIVRAALLAASLLLHTAAMAPWGYSAAAWICLIPLMRALDGLTARQAFFAGLFWGTAQIWLVCHWTAPALSFYWHQPLWFGVAFLLVASGVFVGIYYALWAWLWLRVRRRYAGIGFASLTAALWVTAEFAQARLLGGDPWMLLGYALMPVPLLTQVAEIGGIYLLSFVVVLVNALLSEGWRRGGAASLASPAQAGLVMAAVVGFGWMRLDCLALPEADRRVAVIQGNNDSGAQWNSAEHGRELEAYLRLTREALPSRPELIVWPESAVTFFTALEANYREPIARLVRESGTELILGGPHADTSIAERPRYFNSSFHFDREGQIDSRYDKQHLLPFAEYFPLQSIALLRRRFERVRSFHPGDELRSLDSPFGPVAVSICFEGIFPERVGAAMERGAGVLLNLSNDAWLGTGAGPAQHLSMVALRAIEHRTWVIRATTTGVSAIIDPYGRIAARSAESVEAILTHDIAALHVATIYERIGDSFAWACVAIAAFSLLSGRWRERESP